MRLSCLTLWVAWTLGFMTFTSVNGGIQTWLETPTETPEKTLDHWRGLEEQVKTLADEVFRRVIPTMVRMSSEVELTPQCSGDLLRVVFALRQFKTWAVRMLDATGKPSGGQLEGSLSFLGSYDECLSVRAPPQGHAEEPTLKGMYCVLDIRPPLPPKPKLLLAGRMHPVFRNFNSTLEVLDQLKRYLGLTYFVGVRLAVCLPSTCTQQEVQDMFTKVTTNFGISARVKSCEVDEPMQVDAAQWTFITSLGIFAILVTIATIADGFEILEEKETKRELWRPLVRSFSALSNLRSLMKTQSATSKDKTGPDLSCLSGMRFFSMSWVLLGHTNLLIDFLAQREPLIYEVRLKDIPYQSIVNGTLSVDSFFFITSVLVSYNLLSRYREPKTFSVPGIFLKRIWRLLPAILLTIGLTILLPVLGSGPSYMDFTDDLNRSCRKNWWLAVLFINNYVSPLNACLPHTWYVSLDIQFFVLAIIFVLAYFRWPVWAKGMLFLLVVASTVASTLIIWYLEFTPTLLPLVVDIPNAQMMSRYNYFQMYGHMGVYCIGLVLGAALADGTSFKITKWFLWTGWILSFSCCYAVLHVTVLWNGGYQEPVGLGPAIYGGLHRTVWAAGLAWVTIVCVQGQGGVINDLLSWRGFLPLNRLTYLMYLFHVLVIVYYQGSLRGQVESTQIGMVWLFFGNLLVTFGLAFFFKLLFESPLINVENVITQHLNKSADRTRHDTQEIFRNHQGKVLNGHQDSVTHM